MSTNCTRNDNNTVTLTAVIEGEDWKKAQKKALNQMADHASLKGFRKGKAPASVIKKMYGSEAIRELAADQVAQKVLESLLDEYKVEPIDRPSLKPENMTDESVELVFTVPVAPEVSLDGIDLANLGIEKHVAEVTDEAVQEDLDQLATANAEQVLDEDETPAAEGDLLEIKRKIKEPAELADRPAVPGQVILGQKPVEHDALEQALLGAKPHTTVEYKDTLPADESMGDMAGKEAVVEVEIGDIYHLEKPSDEELPKVQTFYKDVETMDDLKKAIRKQLEDDAKAKANDEYLGAVMTALREKVDVEIPEVMINDEIKNQATQTAYQMGAKSPEQVEYVVKLLTAQPGLTDQLRENAVQKVKEDLILDAIVKKENLDITDEEIEDFLKEFAESQKMDLATVKRVLSVNQIRQSMLRDKAIEKILGE